MSCELCEKSDDYCSACSTCFNCLDKEFSDLKTDLILEKAKLFPLEQQIETLRAEIQAAQSENESQAQRIRGLEEAVLKYYDAIDNIYNHNAAARAAACEHFGIHHPNIAMAVKAKALQEAGND